MTNQSLYNGFARIHNTAGAYWLTVGNYITSGLDYDHSVLVGSYAYEKRTYCYEVLTCGEMELMQKVIQPNDCITEYMCQTYTVTVENIHPNDGIVTLPSQHGLAGATTKTIPQTNHERAKRSLGVRDYLVSQFNSHPYFKIEKKYTTRFAAIPMDIAANQKLRYEPETYSIAIIIIISFALRKGVTPPSAD